MRTGVSQIAQLSKWRVPRVPFVLPFRSLRIFAAAVPRSAPVPFGRSDAQINFLRTRAFIAETGRSNLINGTSTLSLRSFADFRAALCEQQRQKTRQSGARFPRPLRSTKDRSSGILRNEKGHRTRLLAGYRAVPRRRKRVNAKGATIVSFWQLPALAATLPAIICNFRKGPECPRASPFRNSARKRSDVRHDKRRTRLKRRMSLCAVRVSRTKELLKVSPTTHLQSRMHRLRDRHGITFHVEYFERASYCFREASTRSPDNPENREKRAGMRRKNSKTVRSQF